MSIDYAEPGLLTDLTRLDPQLFPTGLSVIETCGLVPGLIIEPDDAAAAGVAAARMAERNLRAASAIFRRLSAISPEPIDRPRGPQQRVVGTCRHYAVAACALLRRDGIASRVRCGFATYFQPGRAVDHWIVEHRDDDGWTRVDPEMLGGSVINHADALQSGDFYSGAEAWAAYRQNQVDSQTFGVYGTGNWGTGEIRGNLVRDLAALNKLEMLPWDDWAKMNAGYDDTAGPEYDELLDRCAQGCNDGDDTAIVELFGSPDLSIPDELLSQSG